MPRTRPNRRKTSNLEKKMAAIARKTALRVAETKVSVLPN